jgi:hypothetical protein
MYSVLIFCSQQGGNQQTVTLLLHAQVGKLMGQYMPFFTKSGRLDGRCRVSHILRDADIEFEHDDQDAAYAAYKSINDRDLVREACAYRIAFGLHYYGSLDAGHANALLHITGLRNEAELDST